MSERIEVDTAELRRLAATLGGVANDVASWRLDLHDAAYACGEPTMQNAVIEFADRLANFRRELIAEIGDIAQAFDRSAADYEAHELAVVRVLTPAP